MSEDDKIPMLCLTDTLHNEVVKMKIGWIT